jgi:hypothetical protein
MERNPDEWEQAVALLSSTMEKCERMQLKFPEGTSQHTLLKNRIKALQISKALLTIDQAARFASEELKQALPPVVSIIDKTTKAQSKHEKGSAKYKQYETLIRTMEIAKAVIEGRMKEMKLSR